MEIAKGSPINTRATEEEERGRLNATDVESLATYPEKVQTKSKKKAMIQVKIRIK